MNYRAAGGPNAEDLSQVRRRLLVTLMYLGLVAYGGAVVLGGERWWVLLSFGPLFVAIAIHFRFILPIAKEVNKKIPNLDERQLALRDRAHYRAYQILGVLFVLTIVYAMLATVLDGVGLPTPETSAQFSGLIFLLTLLVASLPASMIAWFEPDPVPDEG